MIGHFSEAILLAVCSNHGRVKVNDEANKLFEEIDAKIPQLCKATESSWGLIHEPWFNKVNNLTFALGICTGAALVGGVILVVQIIKNKKEAA